MYNVLRFIVEPSQNTFTGYSVTVKWSHDFGLSYRACSFTKWSAAISFVQGELAEFTKVVVHSEFL